MTMENTAENRLGPDLALDAKDQPPTYGGAKTGHGQWCILWAYGEQLGYLWTNGDDGLGFKPTSSFGIQRVPEFYQAFSGGAAAGTPAQEVFDSYAARASQGLSATAVEEGDLDTLPE